MSLHLHGGNVEAASDGYPEDTFTPGQSHPYNYVNDQQAGNIWYHDHALGITRLNVYAGPAGGYLLRDADDTGDSNSGLRLPSGDFELPLIIQDRRFNADGGLYYTPVPWAPEFFGDVATVNGKGWPNLDVRQGLYRFRIYNGSSARFYNLSLSNRQQIIQIGTDTGLLDAPVPLAALLLAPGERADVLLDFKALPVGTRLILRNDAGTPFPSNSPRSPRGGGNPLPEIMQFNVVPGAGNALAVPTALRGAGFANPTVAAARGALTATASRQRTVTLVEIPGPAGPLVVLLNYVYWDETTMDGGLTEQPLVDTVELWNIVSLTVDTHPIHLHLVQFLIQDRQNLQTTQYMRAYAATGPRTVMPGMDPPPAGAPTAAGGYPPPDPAAFLQQRPVPPAANEAGWKDTVQVPPGMVTRILVPFGAKAAANLPSGNSFRGRYV
jgi:FtsP/CotA-like multicopper oxidase with cupredoxin domain